METANRVRIDPTKRTVQPLRVVGDRVSRLWNAANYRCRQAFLSHEGVPTGANLEKLMKDTPEYRQLPSDIAQETLKKLSEAWKSHFQLRAKWAANPAAMDKPGLPKYRKNKKTGERPNDLIPIKHPRSYAIDAKDVHIVLPRDLRPNGATGRLHIAYRGRVRHHGKMGRAEIKYDKTRKRWYFNWSVVAADPKASDGERTAAVDLGVRISASLSIEGMAKAMHFDGREALKDWDFLGREIAREQQAIAHTRGMADDRRSPSSRAISRLHDKRCLRVEHAFRGMAKRIAEACSKAGVARVRIGWPKDILREVSYGSSKWAGRIHNFWSFDRASKILGYALRAVGIAVERVGERGTSSTCPCCGSRAVVRHPRWKLRCKDCGETIHSDQAGSRNLVKFHKPSVSWAGLEASPRTETLRWSRHRWGSRSANPGRAVERDGLEFPLAA